MFYIYFESHGKTLLIRLVWKADLMDVCVYDSTLNEPDSATNDGATAMQQQITTNYSTLHYHTDAL